MVLAVKSKGQGLVDCDLDLSEAIGTANMCQHDTESCAFGRKKKKKESKI